MALKKILLRNKIKTKKTLLEKLRAKDADFEKREAELSAAIEEMTEDTSEEDRAAVEADVDALEREKEEHETEKSTLEGELADLEKELEEEEKRDADVLGASRGREERGGDNHMPAIRRTEFFNMTLEERTAFMADESVRSIIAEVRTCIKEKRALTNAGLTIPDVMLPLIRQVAMETSKLMKHVNLVRVGGPARQNIMGEIPEAYWDEACAAIRELDLAFYNTEIDQYKVSGYFAICNATLEDSDLNLASELMIACGKAIAKAIDKAIIYGRGVKMPMGIVPSLLKTTAPDGTPTTERTWEDLHTTHIVSGTANISGIKLFQEILTTSGIIDNDYDTEGIVWMMNNKTKTKILAESMDKNANAAIVAGMNGEMPVVGGAIETFKYIPDNTVVFGYMHNYLLAERAGTKLAQSEHVRFLDDQTVFKGTARYDGKPVIREAFGVYGIGGAPDTTSPKFAGDPESGQAAS